jgi:hypothetical protein
MLPLKESALLPPVSAYVRRLGYRFQVQELGFYEYRIDIYGFSSGKNSTVAIELKLHKWQRAVQQALIYQLCSDFVFIAMPFRAIRSVDRALLEGHGIGLLAIDDALRCRQILNARRSVEVRDHYRERFIELLSKGDACR